MSTILEVGRLADEASATVAGRMDPTTLAHYPTVPQNTNNILLTHLVHLEVVEAEVTKPAAYESPFSRRRGPAPPRPLLRHATTTSQAEDKYTLPIVVAEFVDGRRTPMNKYLELRLREYVAHDNDVLYKSWFEDNAWMDVGDIEDAQFYVGGERAVDDAPGRDDHEDGEKDAGEERDYGMLVKDLIAWAEKTGRFTPYESE
ncbi:hypothetical protein SPI_01584 [Niveomyces insectorum RCEF 264]|uniref:Uncharacterized protein n=1 Tax=Niveomyces insectorum RCEF 264 TaxID=1081102 RepID=A0A167Z2U0_9HYPO|nr:hypothetical protein SPI_01584 [Niveomyces insectorum RCEF 264]